MSIQLQKQIKNNSEDLIKYVNDLYVWEDEKDKKPKKNKKLKTKKIKKKARNKGIDVIPEVVEEKKQNINLMRDKTTIKDYYDAWDKLDVVFLNIYSRIIFLGR